MGFSPMFSLLKPTFSLPLRPHLLSLMLRTTTERSSTACLIKDKPTASVQYLVPFIFGAGTLDQ